MGTAANGAPSAPGSAAAAASDGAAPGPSDEVEPPLADAPAPSADPAFDAAQPTRGGASPLFEAVPQDILSSGLNANAVPSPDGRLAAVTTNSGTVAILDTRQGVVRASRRLFRRLDDVDVGLYWDGSSSHVVAIADDELCLWHLTTDDYVCTAVNEISALAVSRGGRRIAYVGNGTARDAGHALYTWTLEGRPQVVARLTAPTSVERLAVYGNSIVTTSGSRAQLYDARSRAQPVELGEVSLPEDPFTPNGRSFVTLGDDVVQLRNTSDGAVTREVPLAGASGLGRIALNRDGTRMALCAEDQPVVYVRLGASPSAQTLPDQVCTAQSRPALTGTSARSLPLDADGLHPEHRREMSERGREHSLWSLELTAGRAVLQRRGGAEAFSAAGVRRARAQVIETSGDPFDDAAEFDGLVARSPSRRSALRASRANEPVLLTGSTRVPLQGAHELPCNEYVGCVVSVRWDRAERRVALIHPNLVEVFDTASGARLGTWRTGRGCREECDGAAVCIDGECEEQLGPVGSAEFSPDGERLVAIGADGSVGLHSVTGERLQRLAAPDGSAGTRQSFLFSPDSQFVAFVRRKRLSLLSATDGVERWHAELPQTVSAMAFSVDGTALQLLDSAGQASTLSTTDGARRGTRLAGTVRAFDGQGRYAVTCRDGLTYLQYVDRGTERGPLGRCLRDGRFVIAPDSGLLGYVKGTLARVYRLSDGEVLNLRSVWRDDGRVRVAFTDSGWAHVLGGRANDVYVRTGSVSRGDLRPRGASDRMRGTLLADFFGGVALPPPPGAAPEAPVSAEDTGAPAGQD